MLRFTAEFFGVEQLGGQSYFKLADSLAPFGRGSRRQMAVTMGVRTFGAQGPLLTSSAEARPELCARVKRMDAAMLTAAEAAADAITHARWRQIRDARSSTARLGFRIDAIVTPAGARRASDFDGGWNDVSSNALWRVRDEEEVRAALRSFLPRDAAERPSEAAAAILEQLVALERLLPASPIFQAHEMAGSSLLFVADAAGRGGVIMLDFGATVPCAEGAPLQHTVPWAAGSREDGYLIGLQSLTRLWKEVAEGLVRE